jgi:hypothetical protein
MVTLYGNGGESSFAIERWFVTLCCSLDPGLFASRFRLSVGTLVTHGKAEVCDRISISEKGSLEGRTSDSQFGSQPPVACERQVRLVQSRIPHWSMGLRRDTGGYRLKFP